jgi:hypothetical protein
LPKHPHAATSRLTLQTPKPTGNRREKGRSDHTSSISRRAEAVNPGIIPAQPFGRLAGGIALHLLPPVVVLGLLERWTIAAVGRRSFGRDILVAARWLAGQGAVVTISDMADENSLADALSVKLGLCSSDFQKKQLVA